MRRLTAWELDHLQGPFQNGATFAAAVEARTIWTGETLFRNSWSDTPERESRRAILQLVYEGPQVAAAIAELLEITPGGAAAHLGALEEEGFLRSERPAGPDSGKGRPRVYSATKSTAAELRKLDPTWKRTERTADGAFIREPSERGGRVLLKDVRPLTLADVGHSRKPGVDWRRVVESVWDGVLWTAHQENGSMVPSGRVGPRAH